MVIIWGAGDVDDNAEKQTVEYSINLVNTKNKLEELTSKQNV